MTNLFPELDARLGRLLLRLESDSPSEVVATVAAIRRALDLAGLDLHDLAARLIETPSERHPKPKAPGDDTDLLALAQWFLIHALARLTFRESSFVNNVADLLATGSSLTPKQAKWLCDLYVAQNGN